AEDGIRDGHVTGVQTCALPISRLSPGRQLKGVAPPRQIRGGCSSLQPRSQAQRPFVEVGQVVFDQHYVMAAEIVVEPTARLGEEIGRASCRERVESAEVGE